MNRSIFRHEWRIRRRSVLTWSLSLVALFLVFFSFFPTFADQAEVMNQMMASFPPELITAFGMDQTDFSTVLGYFGFMLLFVQLCLAIQAGNEGVGLVSVEETELTADFLLTTLVVTLSAYGSIALFSHGRPYDPGRLALLMLTLPLFQLFFLSLGLLISLLVKRVRNVTPFALGMAFGAYVLNAFGGVLGEVKLELITALQIFQRCGPFQIWQNRNPLPAADNCHRGGQHRNSLLGIQPQGSIYLVFICRPRPANH